ncbi:MAG: hypothetical protein ACK4GO_02050 [Gemmobacter sp.]
MPENDDDDDFTEEQIETLTAVMNETEEYYSDVTDIAAQNLKSPDLRHFPAAAVKAYRRDHGAAEMIYGKYCDAFDDLRTKAYTKVRLAALQKSYDALLKSTQLVDAANGSFTAWLDQDMAAKCQGMVTLLQGILKSEEARVKTLATEIVALDKALTKADREVTTAELQRDINMLVSVVGAMLPAMKTTTTVFVTIGTIAGKIGMDVMMGPDGPDTASKLKTAASEYLGASNLLGTVGGKLFSAASAADGWKIDSAEVAKARKSLTEIRKRLKSAKSAYDKLMARMDANAREFVRLSLAFEKAAVAGRNAAEKHRAQEQHRRDLRAELGL